MADVNKMTAKERTRHQGQNLCYFCHKPGHIAKVCPNRQRKSKTTQNRPQKVRQLTEESVDDESDTEGNLADNDKSNDKFQIDVTQIDINSYNTDF